MTTDKADFQTYFKESTNLNSIIEDDDYFGIAGSPGRIEDVIVRCVLTKITYIGTWAFPKYRNNT